MQVAHDEASKGNWVKIWSWPRFFESICIYQTLKDNWRHKGCILQISDHGVNRQRLGVSLGQSWEIYPKVKFAAKQTKGRYRYNWKVFVWGRLKADMKTV